MKTSVERAFEGVADRWPHGEVAAMVFSDEEITSTICLAMIMDELRDVNRQLWLIKNLLKRDLERYKEPDYCEDPTASLTFEEWSDLCERCGGD